ncbi:hypothetical protein CLOM_g3336 [Closterium sp. NIES-68]|nr:hypothetical protein CLOM_g3336 [Closterium sp. NIES-68]GJP83831.1 hypothetical protein CLOP_g13934 [Closterium sp. NIES-67]
MASSSSVPFLAPSSLNGAPASRLSETSQAEPSRAMACETDRPTLATSRMSPAMDAPAVEERMYRRKRQRASLGGSAISDQDSEDASNAAESKGPWTWPHQSRKTRAVSGEDVGRILFGKPSSTRDTPNQTELRSKWLEDKKPVTRSGRAAKEKAAAAARMMEEQQQEAEKEVQQQQRPQPQQQKDPRGQQLTNKQQLNQPQQKQKLQLRNGSPMELEQRPQGEQEKRSAAGKAGAKAGPPVQQGRKGRETANRRRVLLKKREDELESQSESVVEVDRVNGLNGGGKEAAEDREVAGASMERGHSGNGREKREAAAGEERRVDGTSGSESVSEASEDDDCEWGSHSRRKKGGMSVSRGKRLLKREHGKQEHKSFVSEKQTYFAEVDAFELEEEEAVSEGN